MLDKIEAALYAYAEETILARQREKADRSELHPGDVGLDIEGEIQLQIRWLDRDAMKAAIEAAERVSTVKEA